MRFRGAEFDQAEVQVLYGILLFINDLPSVVSHSNVHLFADDTFLSYLDSDISSMNEKMNQDLRNIEEWAKINKLILNSDKCKSILFVTAQRRRFIDAQIFRLSICGVPLLCVQDIKLLGVFFDHSLTFKPHVEAVYKKVCKMLGLIRRLSRILSLHHLKLLYNSLVSPHIDNAINIWASCSPSLLSKVSRLQRRAARLICPSLTLNSVDQLKRLNWMSIPQRKLYFTGVLTFKGQTNLAPQYLCNLLSKSNSIHTYSTRLSSSGGLNVPHPRSTLFKQSFEYSAPVLWNSLPQNLQRCTSLPTFKLNYPKYIISQT